MNAKKDILFYAAGAASAIAGIIHLILGIDTENLNTQILFVVGGLTQMFWVLPMIRKWGKVWYLVGIGGTVVLIAIWVITRIPDNPITGRGGRINENGILVEVFQIAFVAITIIILAVEKRRLATKN
jgi:hypothetical protein